MRDGRLEVRLWNNWQWCLTFGTAAGLCEGHEEEVEGVGSIVQTEGCEVDLE
jgi:hypothetical protein